MYGLYMLYERKMRALREESDASTSDSHQPQQQLAGSAAAQARSAASHVLPVNLRFDNIQVVVQVDKRPRTIMEDVSGEFRAGTVTAVLGPSGSGKTTLISAVTGKVPLAGGSVFVNGVRQAQHAAGRYRSLVGFVPQDDVMIRSLTVNDVLQHSAYTRLPASMSTEAKDEIVNQVL